MRALHDVDFYSAYPYASPLRGLRDMSSFQRNQAFSALILNPSCPS